MVSEYLDRRGRKAGRSVLKWPAIALFLRRADMSVGEVRRPKRSRLFFLEKPARAALRARGD